MTGFGRCVIDNPAGRQEWEIRSVNGRFLDIKWKLPKFVRSSEFQLEKIVKRHAGRGRVEISLAFLPAREHAPKPVFDAASAGAMLAALKNFSDELKLDFKGDAGAFLLMADLWSEPAATGDPLIMRELEEGLAVALADWNASRQMEGQALVKDLADRVALMRNWLDRLEKMAPLLRESRAEAFRIRIGELLRGSDVDASRVNQELVLLSDRMDASEELTRLTAHLARLDGLLRDCGPDLGKRLDFTLQECFREINTCGNKMLDADVSSIIVDFKNELEKCREQAMNLE